jgi:aryl-alcohol dehydrogenase-like predicted oxidoreductase
VSSERGIAVEGTGPWPRELGRSRARQRPSDLRGQPDALARAAGRVGANEDAVALAAVLARPWVDTVLSGASTVAQLESNLAAVQVRWDDSLDAELAPIVEQPEQYWKTRSSLPWT